MRAEPWEMPIKSNTKGKRSGWHPSFIKFLWPLEEISGTKTLGIPLVTSHVKLLLAHDEARRSLSHPHRCRREFRWIMTDNRWTLGETDIRRPCVDQSVNSHFIANLWFWRTIWAAVIVKWRIADIGHERMKPSWVPVHPRRAWLFTADMSWNSGLLMTKCIQNSLGEEVIALEVLVRVTLQTVWSLVRDEHLILSI